MLRVATDHFSHSDTGRQRRTNEDAFLARAPVFVVADGMGGAQAGEVASRVAVETFERGLGEASAGSAEQLLAERVQAANARIYEMSQAEQGHAGMGTTLTAAHVGEHDVAIAHVGDSRAYRLRDGQFERLTEDHSLVEEMRRRGQLTAQEADEHPQRSVITRALGPEPDVRVDTHSWRGEAGDVYLLCSDGLTSMVSESRVADIVRTAANLQDAGRKLIAAANDAGGRDNITVLLFRLEEVDAADPAGDQPTSAGQSSLTTAEVRAATARESAVATAPPPPAPARRLQPRPPAAPAGPQRSRRGRRWAIVFVVVAIFVVPLTIGAYIADQSVYFVGTDANGLVTVYRGLPYELPGGISMYKTNYVSGVPLSSVPAARRKKLIDHTLRSHDDANDLVRELELGRIQS
ncbi:MAG: family protein phosphatase [Solirubrobacteraceae bacterium]|jgi:protein phosphatase|nr:family protein phosphatase [Solirubrobacteraceae bacterium]